MKLATRNPRHFREKQRFRLKRLGKRLYQRIRFRPHHPKTVLLIVGCQRSGTTMIHHLFRQDWTAVTYDELSPLSVLAGEEPLRWRSVPEVVARIAADRSPFVAAKPLVESQRLRTWLDALPNARAIWMYRDVRDVVSSGMQYFGEQVGLRDIAPILARDAADWRCEGLSAEAAGLVERLGGADPTPADAAALFWYARNSLFFSTGLVDDGRVALCSYGDLVTSPAAVMAAAYRHLGRPYPGDRIVADVFAGSKGKGGHVVLSEPVAEACGRMQAALDARPRL